MFNFIFHPIVTFNVWRLNRWIVLRSQNIKQKEALRRSFLSPAVADRLLSNTLVAQMRSVGYITIGRGKVIGGTSFDQIGLILCSLADLSSALPEKRAKEIKDHCIKLCDHNWGGVRRAAQLAMTRFKEMETQECAK